MKQGTEQSTEAGAPVDSDQRTELEKMMGLSGTEPDTVIVKVVPRAAVLPCGRDALGLPLSEGDPMICLCCGARGVARVLTDDERHMDGGFDFHGSSWVKMSKWLHGVLPSKMVSGIRNGAGDP